MQLWKPLRNCNIQLVLSPCQLQGISQLLMLFPQPALTCFPFFFCCFSFFSLGFTTRYSSQYISLTFSNFKIVFEMFSRPCGSFDFAFGFRAPNDDVVYGSFLCAFQSRYPYSTSSTALCASPTCRCSCCHPRVHCHVAHHCHHHDDASLLLVAVIVVYVLVSMYLCIFVSLYLVQLEVNLLCKSMCLRKVSFKIYQSRLKVVAASFSIN